MKTQTCFTFSIQLFALCFLVGAIYTVNGDYCEINVCSNGGSCVTGPRSSFICICPDGYTGDTCNDTETGPCNPNPCKNDAFCDVTGQKRRGDVFSEYICKCQDGFDGVHCQNNVNDCANQPCQNGGSCRDLNGDFNCRCPSPYVGKHCQLRCISLLGMEGGGIAESQISASSVHYGFLGLQRWGSELARLHNKGLVNAWTSASYDRNPWIEINMQRKMRFTGIVTQGASRMGSAEFIKAFKVASSLDGRTYTMYRLDRQTKDTVFVGNVDNDSTKTNLFDPPIIGQYFRIIPVVCRKACTLRMELVGCELNVYSNTAGCSEPLGMKSRLLADRQISASSVYRTWGIEPFTWQPHYARLDKQGKTNAWTADTTKRSEWLQVDLESPKKITGIITQGAKDFGAVQFVSAFKVSYSDDGQFWSIVKDDVTSTDKIFPGNSDNNVHKKNLFEPPFYARFVRILPWAWHGRITLRMELLGCDE
ncbi:EGF-like repeat and discoidin I-like domain-containing protein 3 isoform X2 [Salvelinus fontinalis]|uniref:EGF-like repeat and discoidin I-like domain-containing protein 3 isoform X2 n=1 Tax=Salvelinus fontinalis TaxID=8038 RepID=UPI002484F957|nr:EGF-like repeat and discoidin I-like domain-containing protein 3 isoform X2 [Salvelinus fontinalis]